MTLEELSPLSKRCVEAEARVRELAGYLERVLSFAKGNEYTTLERSLALRGARALLDEIAADATAAPRLARGTSSPESSDGALSEAGELVEPAGLPAGEAGAK